MNTLHDSQGEPIRLVNGTDINHRGIAFIIRSMLQQGVPAEAILEAVKQLSDE